MDATVADVVFRCDAPSDPKLPIVGFFSANPAAPTVQYTAAFRAGLANTGFAEGKNVLVEYRWAEGHLERLPEIGPRSNPPSH
jgi:putative ABC transport system substrate-binding protein